jgi:hypothetical protein
VNEIDSMEMGRIVIREKELHHNSVKSSNSVRGDILRFIRPEQPNVLSHGRIRSRG